MAERSEAIACAVAIAEPGDVVVIAGSKTRPGWAFAVEEGLLTDSEVAKQLLYARPEPAFRLVG